MAKKEGWIAQRCLRAVTDTAHNNIGRVLFVKYKEVCGADTCKNITHTRMKLFITNSNFSSNGEFVLQGGTVSVIHKTRPVTIINSLKSSHPRIELIINNSTLSKCRAKLEGGAVSVSTNSLPTTIRVRIISSVFLQNHAPSGGAISSNAINHISNCHFNINTDIVGGALLLSQLS